MPRASMTQGTTYTAAVLLPPAGVSQPLPCHQVPIGVNLLNLRQTVYFDPFILYDNHTITNRNMAFVGHVGHGKSATIKTTLERMLILPEELDDGTHRLRRAVIIDRKPEYGLLAELFGCQPVVVGHGHCLNPFDPRLTPQQLLGVFGSILELLRGRPLDDAEGKAAALAYRQAAASGEPLTLALVHDALARLAPESLTKIDAAVRDEVKRAGIFLSFKLDKLIDGALAGLFDGPTTPALDWAGQVVDVQVHPDYLVSERELVYQLLVAVVAVWLDQAWQTPDPHRRVDFLVADEAWDYVKVRQFAALLQDSTKLGRSHRLSVIVSFQGASDADSAGDVGQAQRDMARRLLKDIGVFFLFGQSPEDAELLRGVAQLTDDDITNITNLEPHTFLLVLGTGDRRRRCYVGHRINELEATLVNSENL